MIICRKSQTILNIIMNSTMSYEFEMKSQQFVGKLKLSWISLWIWISLFNYEFEMKSQSYQNNSSMLGDDHYHDQDDWWWRLMMINDVYDLLLS